MSSSPSGALFVVVLGTLMVAIDTTVVVLALPTMTEELHADLSSSLWALLGYLLVTAILATQLGRVGDIFGRKTIYNLGFAVFTLGSALCGLSMSVQQLISFRIVQALGGAMMVANSGAIIADNFPRNARGKAFGYTTLGWNSGATAGIVLGGVITTLLGWRYIFFINIPIGIAAVLLGYFWIKPSPKVPSKLDLPGLFLLSGILAMATIGSSEIASSGLSVTSTALLLSSLLLLAPFIFVESKHDYAMVDISAFRSRILAYALFSSFLQSVGYLSVMFMVTMYLQGIRGIDPLHTSLLLVPGYVLSSFIAPFTGRLSDKLGSRLLATSGMLLMLTSVMVYVFISVSSPLWVVILASLISGTGGAMFYPANNSAIMANAPSTHYGSISGLARTLGNVGTLISYALTISVSSLSVPRYIAFQVFLGTSDVLGGLTASFMQGIRTSLLVAAGILAAGLVLSAMRGKEFRGLQSQLPAG
ncbi:MAG: MFS transporter [Conexivisphaerales archaeon]